MIWIIGIVTFNLVMTVLVVVELRESVKGNALRLPDLLFVITICTVSLIYVMSLLTAKIWL
jgi:hypothetical protein